MRRGRSVRTGCRTPEQFVPAATRQQYRPPRYRESGFSCSSKATTLKIAGDCHGGQKKIRRSARLSPIACGEERGPIERMRAVSLSPEAAQGGEISFADGIG